MIKTFPRNKHSKRKQKESEIRAPCLTSKLSLMLFSVRHVNAPLCLRSTVSFKTTILNLRKIECDGRTRSATIYHFTSAFSEVKQLWTGRDVIGESIPASWLILAEGIFQDAKRHSFLHLLWTVGTAHLNIPCPCPVQLFLGMYVSHPPRLLYHMLECSNFTDEAFTYRTGNIPIFHRGITTCTKRFFSLPYGCNRN